MRSKRPLNYQSTECDCVPTSYVNALVWMLERKVHPEILKAVWTFCLDGDGRGGTSDAREEALVHYLSAISKAEPNRLPGQFRFVHVEGTNLGESEKLLNKCLDDGGCAIVSIWYDTTIRHVALCIGRERGNYYFFDSYWRYTGFKDSHFVKWKPSGFLDDSVTGGISESIARHANTRVSRGRLFCQKVRCYSMGKPSITFIY